MKLFLYFVSLVGLSLSPFLFRSAHAPIELVGFWRLVFSAIVLSPVLMYHREHPFQRVKPTLWARKSLNVFVLLSALFFFAHMATYFYAMQTTRIANGMILYSTNPLWVALGNWLFFKQKLTARVLVSYALAMSGIVVLMQDSFGAGAGLLRGDASALLTAFLFAGYILTGKAARANTSNSTYAFFVYLVSGGLFGVYTLLNGTPFLGWPSPMWLATAGLVVFPTLLGHALFTWLMKFMDINKMTCGKLLEPVIAAVLAAWMYGEDLSTRTVGAFLLTSLGVLLLFLPPFSLRKQARAD